MSPITNLYKSLKNAFHPVPEWAAIMKLPFSTSGYDDPLTIYMFFSTSFSLESSLKKPFFRFIFGIDKYPI